jgi:hypothetical protein
LRTLVHSIPDLSLLDITIGYPGVPFGEYPQEWYGLGSVFWRSVPPPVVRVHLRLYNNLGSPSSSEVPSLSSSVNAESMATIPAATPDEARTFELWLRDVWTRKEAQVKKFAQLSAKALGTGQDEISVNDSPCQVVPVAQQ